MKNYGFIKVASVNFDVKIANVKSNVETIIKQIKALDPQTRIAVFPQLCLCGYSAQDLMYQKALLDACLDGLQYILDNNDSEAIIGVGLPLQVNNLLYNVAAIIYKKEVLAFIPQSNIANYNEYYESRWFASSELRNSDFINFKGNDVLFTPNVIIKDLYSQASIACEIGSDLEQIIPTSSKHLLHGANIIMNLSASDMLVGKSDYLSNLIKMHSDKGMCGYIYTSANQSESTSDVVFSGNKFIYDNGRLINEDRFIEKGSILYGEIDVERCMSDRLKVKPYAKDDDTYYTIEVALKPCEVSLTRTIDAYPFIPKTNEEARCNEILNIQAMGLAQRLKKINCNKVVIGISGGLDSTLALIVAIKAFEINEYPSENIYAITMPGFGTSNRTYDNSMNLMKGLNLTYLRIPIKDACMQHFTDIDFDYKQLGITYENAQARERTQILMDYANKINAIVVGTGDLSEMALGWCTYNGDHMSNYAVNASIPKTLVRYLVQTYANQIRRQGKGDIADILDDICITPVSPELLPPDETGEISQKTEASIGSYDLHDFFLYHVLRNQYAPDKVFFLAKQAFDTDDETILKTLKMFYRRFFTQQFKRNCVPDGVKVGSVALSPRGDLRMPSDASFSLWMEMLEQL